MVISGKEDVNISIKRTTIQARNFQYLRVEIEADRKQEKNT